MRRRRRSRRSCRRSSQTKRARASAGLKQHSGDDMTGPEIEKTEIAHRGWTTLSVVTFALPDGTKFNREIEDHGRAACVLPYDPERRTALLVRQFRAAVFLTSGETDLLEAIAGVV